MAAAATATAATATAGVATAKVVMAVDARGRMVVVMVVTGVVAVAPEGRLLVALVDSLEQAGWLGAAMASE